MLKTNNLDNYEKINCVLLKVICLSWLVIKFIGWRMFTAYRTFPTIPLFESFDQLPSILHTILFVLSIILLLLLLVTKKNKPALYCLLIAEILSILLDLNRLQPREYQYLFFILIFIINRNDQRLLTVAFTFILACTYFYSGVGKLNSGFLQTVWIKMIIHPIFKTYIIPHWVYYSGYLAGCLECIAGIGLLLQKTRKIAAGALMGVHFFILILFGPLELNYNMIVWPWNTAMIIYLYVIFLKKDPVSIPINSIFKGWNKLVFACWGVLPAFNLIGYWDTNLSSGMYSGKQLNMLICVTDTSKCKPLQKFCKKDNFNMCSGGQIIDLQYWALIETNASPYREVRTYKIIQHKLEKQYPAAGMSFFYFVKGRPLQ